MLAERLRKSLAKALHAAILLICAVLVYQDRKQKSRQVLDYKGMAPVIEVTEDEEGGCK